MRKFATVSAAIALAGATFAAAPVAVSPAAAQACGHYVILGCFRSQGQAISRLNALGGPGVGGWAGAHVVNTNDYPNFRNGWWCVADGPYASRDGAMSIAWKEAVPDAYVKNGC
jgi:hypothetical protein